MPGFAYLTGRHNVLKGMAATLPELNVLFFVNIILICYCQLMDWVTTSRSPVQSTTFPFSLCPDWLSTSHLLTTRIPCSAEVKNGWSCTSRHNCSLLSKPTAFLNIRDLLGLTSLILETRTFGTTSCTSPSWVHLMYYTP